MSWAQRLFGLGSVDTAAEVRKELGSINRGLIEQARRLGTDAALAPNTSAAGELRALAAEDEALATDLKPHLPTGRSVEIDGMAPSGPSHWARVNDALDRHRQTHEALIFAIAHLTDIAPDVAQLCERLSRAEEGHIKRLLDLGARADPQALD